MQANSVMVNTLFDDTEVKNRDVTITVLKQYAVAMKVNELRIYFHLQTW